MKRSQSVPLVLLGTLGLATLAGCGPSDPNVPVKQQRYATQQDCLSDWGNDQRNCQRSGTGYVGPHYFWNHSGGYPMVIDSNGTQRAVTNSHFSSPGASSSSVGRAVSSTSSNITVPAQSSIGRAAAPVARAGFGSTGSSFSSSGG